MTAVTAPLAKGADGHAATWPLVRRLFGSYLWPHRGALGVALIFMAINAATTGAMARLMQPVMDGVFEQRDPTLVIPVATLVFIAFVVRGLSDYFHSVMVADLQKQLYGHLLGADLSFFHATATGNLISRVINDVMVMRGAMAECLTSLGKSSLTLVFLVGVMF